jgi:AAT family amino acid transporter
MLIVMFTYAGFEITGLAAVEAKDSEQTIPRTIAYTVVTLVGLYIVSLVFLLPLVPTSILSEETSPLVAGLTRNGLIWAGGIMNNVMISAILSTMLAATFGIGQMLYSLAEEGHAPSFLKDKTNIPYRGILFSGFSMLIGLAMGYILPKQVYIFLVSSGGFSFLFVYTVILITHYKHRKKYGCPPQGKCTLPGYPYTSWIAIIGLIAIIASMPLIPGQGSGLIAGLLLVSTYLSLYIIFNKFRTIKSSFNKIIPQNKKMQTDMETAEEITQNKKNNKENNQK